MDAIIVQSAEQKLKWLGTGRLRKTKIVPIGFNKEYLYPLDIGERNKFRLKNMLTKEDPVLVYVGAMTIQRELEKLIYAVKGISKEFPKIKLLMIGNGNNLAKLKSLAMALNLQSNIIFIGIVPYEEINRYYGIADIGISYIPINANYNYNPPLKTYEYLACGLPCVATRTVSNSVIIKDQENGILVSDNSEEIASAVINLLKDRKKLKYLRQNALKSIDGLDFKTITQKNLLPIYNQF